LTDKYSWQQNQLLLKRHCHFQTALSLIFTAGLNSKNVLPTVIAQHALHCVVNDKKLLIYTDTAAWATQLRFYNSTILAAIAPVTKESISIMQIKIMMETLRATPLPGRTPIIPSAEKIKLIRNHSLTVSDQQLKLALLRLSATLAKLSERQATA
jgi:hypothetical protein